VLVYRNFWELKTGPGYEYPATRFVPITILFRSAARTFWNAIGIRGVCVVFGVGRKRSEKKTRFVNTMSPGQTIRGSFCTSPPRYPLNRLTSGRTGRMTRVLRQSPGACLSKETSRPFFGIVQMLDHPRLAGPCLCCECFQNFSRSLTSNPYTRYFSAMARPSRTHYQPVQSLAM